MPKKTVSDFVYEQLMKDFLGGKYQPGQKLPSEYELSEELKASRNTVRSALMKLNTLGVIETRRGDGTFFKGIGTSMYVHDFIPSLLVCSNDLMGLMMFRRGVEITSARLAAINATKEDIEDLENYLKRVKEDRLRGNAYAKATNEFHNKIAKASKNDVVAKILEVIGLIITSNMADFLKYKPEVEDSFFYHQMIFLCIKHHKEDDAAFMMDRHMQLLIERVKDYTEHFKQKDSKEKNDE